MKSKITMEKEIKSNQKLLTWMRLNVSIQFKAKFTRIWKSGFQNGQLSVAILTVPMTCVYDILTFIFALTNRRTNSKHSWSRNLWKNNLMLWNSHSNFEPWITSEFWLAKSIQAGSQTTACAAANYKSDTYHVSKMLSEL